MKTAVAVVKGKYSSGLTKKVLDMVKAERLIHPKDRILIKPNCVVAKSSSTGLTTDPRIIEDTIEFIKHLGTEELVVAEGGAGHTTEKAFDITGMREVARRQGIALIDLNRDTRIEVKIKKPLKLHRIEIAESVYNSTCIINVPTLKVHSLALTTLSMKNLMGTILPKNIMHENLDAKIVDLAAILKDKVKLNIIDGIVGAETDEVHGTPVEMNLLIAGSDMVAVDTVSTAIMGIDPKKVKYLQLAAKCGLGISNLNEIEILGEPIDSVKRKFKLPPEFSG
ncbi:MAG: DUF362 domain-containing protein [Candidatus Bathyarchaeota archaeon]|nr:MAG: DUF362 domain-containing protein [Candidatus Bathyarchaeota archaeon]